MVPLLEPIVPLLDPMVPSLGPVIEVQAPADRANAKAIPRVVSRFIFHLPLVFGYSVIGGWGLKTANA